jgi:hypothetical protein
MADSRYELGSNGSAPTVREASYAEHGLDSVGGRSLGAGRARLCLLGVVGGAALALDLPTGAKTTIGRSAEADLAVSHPTISRVHAALFVTQDGERLRCEVEDLGSLNGTRARGRRLAANERVELRVGDTLELGSTTFVLQRRMAASASQPPRPAPVLVSSTPTARSLGEAIESPLPQPVSLQAEIDELERDRILRALEDCGGNQSRAAKLLGMNRGTLIRRLESYRVPRPRK